MRQSRISNNATAKCPNALTYISRYHGPFIYPAVTSKEKSFSVNGFVRITLIRTRVGTPDINIFLAEMIFCSCNV